MEFRVLGPLEVMDGEEPLALGGPKPRALLARLLLDVNHTVPVARLVDDLWGDDAPGSAVKMVQINVSQLRKVLPEGILRTQAPGYLVTVEPEAVDLTRFTRLRDEGRAALAGGDPATAAAKLREALALWRGPALEEFAEPFARVEGVHLEELRLVCLEDRIEADVAVGRHADVVGEVESLVARHPLRETLHGHLILALYRSGRQAEALAAYERFRRTLDDELGIEPSAALKDLQYGILNQDRALDPAPAPKAPAVRAERPPRAGGTSPFVGRDEDLYLLELSLDAASQSHGRAVLVTGRPGIGKTRLCTELAERAAEAGATVLSGRCIQLVGAGLPYLPFVELLRSVPRPDLAVDLVELPRLMPELTRAKVPEEPPGEDSRLRLFEEILAVLDHAARESPLVLVLEDLHWADESTLDLVAYLAHSVREEQILIVATYRSDEVREGHHLHRLAAGLVGANAAIPLSLEPLDRSAIDALLAAAGGDIPPAVRAAIAERAEGNPFFARELLAAAELGVTAVPPVLRDLLLANVARLRPDARSVLRVAAAAGRDVPYRLLDAVLPLDELELPEALREAVDHDVLVADHVAGTFRFRHSLFADAVYESLLPGEREVLHERIARALTANPAMARDGATAAELAQHWAAAGRPIEALGASLQAARDAEAVSGLTEALGHVERVLELWDRVPAAEELTGVALPSVLAWAAELAGLSVQREDEIDALLLMAILPPGETVSVADVAGRLDVEPEAASETLSALERDGLVEVVGPGTYRAARLAVSEARRLYPSVVVLESLAVRQSPPFDSMALTGLRAANARLRAAVGDPATAMAADDDFHRRLTARCGNDHLLSALRPIRRALLRYERVYMVDPEHIERSVAQHDAIIRALERGDHAEAAQGVRENLSGGLPALTEALERR